MKTTLEIPEPLFRQVKARAAMDGIKMKDLVASALVIYLTEPNLRAKRQAKGCPFPLVHGKGGPLLRKISNETIARLEEDEDLERHGRSFRR